MSYAIAELEIRCGDEIKGVWLLDPTHSDPRTVAEHQFGAERVVSVRVHARSNDAILQALKNTEEQP